MASTYMCQNHAIPTPVAEHHTTLTCSLLLISALCVLQAVPESVLMLYNTSPDDTGGDTGLFLHVGLNNGVLMRTGIDRTTGKLSDTRQRFLGTRPPKLVACSVRGQRSMLALSSRPWLGYTDMGRFQIMPLSYEALDYAAVRAFGDKSW